MPFLTHIYLRYARRICQLLPGIGTPNPYLSGEGGFGNGTGTRPSNELISNSWKIVVINEVISLSANRRPGHYAILDTNNKLATT